MKNFHLSDLLVLSLLCLPGAAQAQDVALTYGENPLEEDLVSAFMAENPGITMRYFDSGKDPVSLLLSREAQPDIFILLTMYNDAYYTLFQRNYLPEIQSATLAGRIQKMYPAGRSWVTRDGKPVGLPLNLINSMARGANRPNIEALALKLPETWGDLFNILKVWGQYGDQTPLRLFAAEDSGDLARRVLGQFLQDYDEYIRSQQTYAGYDNHVFRNLLLQYDAVDFDAIAAIEAEKDADAGALFTLNYDCTLNGFRLPDCDFLPLSVGEDVQPKIGFNFAVAVVNPYSEHPLEAARFLEFLEAHLSDEARIMLYPEENDPVAEDNSELIELVQKDIAILQDQPKTAAPVDRLPIEEMLAAEQATLEDARNGSWRISPEEIQNYRQAAQYMTIDVDTGLFGDNAAARDQLFEQYLGGAIDADAYIRRCEEYSRMQYLENQG